MSGRIRTIKPEVHEDEDAAGLSDAAWRLWVGSWVLCDDHGNCRAGAKYLAAQIWQDSTRADVVDGYLAELVRVGKIDVYETSGGRYLHVKGWAKHQRVDNAGRPRVPQPTDRAGNPDMRIVSFRELAGGSSESRGESPRTSASLDELPLARARAQSSGEDHDHRPPTTTTTTDRAASADAEACRSPAPPEEEHSEPTKPRATKATKGTRVPDDFKPSDATVQRFRAEGWDPLEHVEEFVDFWRAVPGAKGVKLDWDATFRNRMRELIARGRATAWEQPAEPRRPRGPEGPLLDREFVRQKLAEAVANLKDPTVPDGVQESP